MSNDKQQRLSPEFWYKFMQIAHHVIVIVDDFLCEQLDLSRKPKGKYADPTYPERFDKRR
jgi:hypothetical protein